MLSALKHFERLEVAATDGDIGRIVEFLFDDVTWAIRHLVVETGVIDEHRVLVSPAAFAPADPVARRFRLSLTRDEVVASPSADSDRPVYRQHGRFRGRVDAHLRSANEVRGYHLQGSDDAIGHVTDLLVDEWNWDVRFLVVDTNSWWWGNKVLVAPSMVRKISWEDRKVFVEMTRQAIKDSPSWDRRAEPRTATAHFSEAEELVERNE